MVSIVDVFVLYLIYMFEKLVDYFLRLVHLEFELNICLSNWIVVKVQALFSYIISLSRRIPGMFCKSHLFHLIHESLA